MMTSVNAPFCTFTGTFTGYKYSSVLYAFVVGVCRLWISRDDDQCTGLP